MGGGKELRLMYLSPTLPSRWDTLQALAAKRKDTLADAMEKASDFNNSWKEEVGWLSEAERQAYADWKPSGLPETCEADIHKHKVSARRGDR